MLWKCYTHYASKFGKLSSGHRARKGQFSFQSQRRAMPKKCSNYHTIALISHASKVILKILQAKLQWYVNWELPDVQTGFIKGRGARNQIVNIHGIIEKARKIQKKTSTSSLLTTLKPLPVWVTINYRKFSKRWEYQTTLPTSSKTCMYVKKQQLESLMVPWTGSKLGKSAYCHPAYLTYIQSTSY